MALTHRTRRRTQTALIAPLLLAACLISAPAAAWHEPNRPVTEYSAATLNGGEWRLYLGTLLEYGVVDNLEIGTMPLLLVARVPNVFAKWTFVPAEGFSMALSGGVVTTNPNYFGDLLPDVQVYVIPVGLFASWRLPGGDIGLHGGLHYTRVGTSGSGSLGEAFDVEADVQGSSLKLAPVLELRTSRSFAWVIEGSLSLSQSAAAAFATSFTSADGRTTVEVFGDGSIDDQGGKWLGNASVSAYWSWETFNLRLGVGYGYAELPVLGVFLDQLTVLPKFNAYWRF